MRSLLPPLLALILGCGGAGAATVEADRPELSFHYAWPELPPNLPRLEARLRAEAAEAQRRALAKAKESWATDRSDTGEDPPRHSYDKGWTVSATTPQLLALSAASQFYTGGAHEGIAYDGLLWDRGGDRELALSDLFSKPRDALRIIERAYCRELESEQRERRGEGFSEADFHCPPLAEQPKSLAGAKGRVTRLEVLLQPYAAGSWAEGPYELEVPLTREVLRLVKPKYRASFIPPRR